MQKQSSAKPTRAARFDSAETESHAETELFPGRCCNRLAMCSGHSLAHIINSWSASRATGSRNRLRLCISIRCHWVMWPAARAEGITAGQSRFERHHNRSVALEFFHLMFWRAVWRHRRVQEDVAHRRDHHQSSSELQTGPQHQLQTLLSFKQHLVHLWGKLLKTHSIYYSIHSHLNNWMKTWRVSVAISKITFWN